MATTSPGTTVSRRTASLIVVGMLAMIAVPADITLHTVRHPATLAVPENPSPYGYTWSLLLFIIPIVVIAFWFVPHEQITIPKRAFWRTNGILAPLGFGLDFFFACRLFSVSQPPGHASDQRARSGPACPGGRVHFLFRRIRRGAADLSLAR